MKIGIFVTTAGRRGGGPETYEIQLIRALARLDKTNRYTIYCTTKSGPPAIGVSQPNFSYRVLWPGNRWISIPVALPLMLILDRVDFYHATVVPPPWSTKPLILSILCSSNWTHPEFYPKRVVWRLNKLLAKGLNQAQHLCCISQKLIEDVNDMWRVPRERMSVTYMGVGPEFYPRSKDDAQTSMKERYGITGRFLLFIGQQQERKNVFRTVEAYAKARREAGAYSLPKLLLVGREDDPNDPIGQCIRNAGVVEHVVRLRYIDHKDLPELYSVADALVFPSLWEGFGIPIIEAMACGAPVVTSTATCLPEVAGDAALIVDPESVDAIADAILRVQQDNELRRVLIDKGLRRAQSFTWENCARTTLEAYENMRQPVEAEKVLREA